MKKWLKFVLCCSGFHLLLILSLSHAGQKQSRADSAPVAGQPTFCAGEDTFWDTVGDLDVVVKEGSNLTVMFHGNRYPAAIGLVTAFEKANPGIRVSYSTLPPVSVILKLGKKNFDTDFEAIAKKITPLGYPDVVMVPEVGLKEGQYKDELINPVMYSRISGLVAITRADDLKISRIEDLRRKDVRIVLAGGAGRSVHGIYRGTAAFFGEEMFEQIKSRSSTSYSQLMHHRSVPARILLGCADVGFQFAQSQKYLEKWFPGKLRYLKVPNTTPGIFDLDNSYIAVTKESKHREAAVKFRNFVLGPKGQAILARYKLDLGRSPLDRPAGKRQNEK